jgi:hypothetical protein
VICPDTVKYFDMELTSKWIHTGGCRGPFPVLSLKETLKRCKSKESLLKLSHKPGKDRPGNFRNVIEDVTMGTDITFFTK